MTHHFANYRKNQPKEYAAFSDSMWNTFVTVTHKVGFKKFFSFTPDFGAVQEDYDPAAIGRELGKIYNYTNDPHSPHN